MISVGLFRVCDNETSDRSKPFLRVCDGCRRMDGNNNTSHHNKSFSWSKYTFYYFGSLWLNQSAKLGHIKTFRRPLHRGSLATLFGHVYVALFGRNVDKARRHTQFKGKMLLLRLNRWIKHAIVLRRNIVECGLALSCRERKRREQKCASSRVSHVCKFRLDNMPRCWIENETKRRVGKKGKRRWELRRKMCTGKLPRGLWVVDRVFGSKLIHLWAKWFSSEEFHQKVSFAQAWLRSFHRSLMK